MTSGLFTGTLIEELERFGVASGPSSRPGKKAATARDRTNEAQEAGGEAIAKGAADVEGKKKTADSKLNLTGAAVGAIADYRINDAGYILQRLEEAVHKELREGKLKELEVSIEKDKGLMLASFFEAQKRTSDTIAGLKKWGKAAAVRGVGKVMKTGELKVPGIGTYEDIMEKQLAAMDAEFLKQFLRDYVHAISGSLMPVASLKGVLKSHHKLVQRTAALLDVEQERAAGAWLQIMLRVAVLIDADIDEVRRIYDAETFAHAEPGFVAQFRLEGPRTMNKAAAAVINRLAEDHDDERWVRLKDKGILSPVEVEIIVKGLTERVIVELKKIYTWLGDS